jgi:hypothetical protein
MSTSKWLDHRLKCVIKYSMNRYWKKPLHVKLYRYYSTLSLKFEHHKSQNEIHYRLLHSFSSKIFMAYGIYLKCVSNLFCFIFFQLTKLRLICIIIHSSSFLSSHQYASLTCWGSHEPVSGVGPPSMQSGQLPPDQQAHNPRQLALYQGCWPLHNLRLKKDKYNLTSSKKNYTFLNLVL